MKNALRLGSELVRQAEAEGRIQKRSTPKQIEYWAEIGKQVASQINPNDLVALTQGFAHLRVEMAISNPVSPDEVFKSVENSQSKNQLAAQVTKATIYYEASQTHPGLLDCIQADGSRETGHFHNGQFVPATDTAPQA